MAPVGGPPRPVEYLRGAVPAVTAKISKNLRVETHHVSDHRHLHPEKHSPRSCRFDRSSIRLGGRSILFGYARPQMRVKV
jgi:hypothetical protein